MSSYFENLKKYVGVEVEVEESTEKKTGQVLGNKKGNNTKSFFSNILLFIWILFIALCFYLLIQYIGNNVPAEPYDPDYYPTPNCGPGGSPC